MAALYRLYGDDTESFQPCHKHEERRHICSKYWAASSTSGPPHCDREYGGIHDNTFARHSAPTEFRASKVRDAACSFSYPQSGLLLDPSTKFADFSQKPLII